MRTINRSKKPLGFSTIALVMIFFGSGSLTTSANAALISYAFEGTVTSVPVSMSAFFTTSQTISGSFTYDSNAANNNMGGQVGFFTSALNRLQFKIGAMLGNSEAGSILVLNDDGSYNGVDIFGIGFSNLIIENAPVFPFVASFGLVLEDDQGQVFSSFEPLPPSLTLSAFSGRNWNIRLFLEPPQDPPLLFEGERIVGDITSLTPVPLPSTAILFMSGLGWLVLKLRKNNLGTI